MKNRTLTFKTDQLTEAAKDFEESYTIGHQLGEIGRLIRYMAMHISDLQVKVDSQAEELRKYQQKTYNPDKIVEQLDKMRAGETPEWDDGFYTAVNQAIEIVKKGGAE